MTEHSRSDHEDRTAPGGASLWSERDVDRTMQALYAKSDDLAKATEAIVMAQILGMTPKALMERAGLA